ncbi:MAG: secondary thiamine-phosphate synthase enzyme YjbQ [Pseudomonadota bacterium]
MPSYQKEFVLSSRSANEVVDITSRVKAIVRDSKADGGIVTVFTPHATAAVTVNENADPNVAVDFIEALRRMVPDHNGWLHDRVDDNAAAHIKAAIVGPSVAIPLKNGQLGLGTWQNIFLCEFDGPRSQRRVIVTVIF